MEAWVQRWITRRMSPVPLALTLATNVANTLIALAAYRAEIQATQEMWNSRRNRWRWRACRPELVPKPMPRN